MAGLCCVSFYSQWSQRELTKGCSTTRLWGAVLCIVTRSSNKTIAHNSCEANTIYLSGGLFESGLV